VLEPARPRRKYRLLPARATRRAAEPAARAAAAPEAAARRPRTLDEVARERCGRTRHELIAEAAYFRALAGYGLAQDHWLAAEREIDALLMREAGEAAPGTP
jgi:hypothetical protein